MANANMGSTPLLVTPVNSSGMEGGQVTGNVASGSADSGNPVKTAAVYNATLPSPSTGERVDSQSDTRGNLRSRLVTHIAPGYDAVSNNVQGYVSAFDGSQNLCDLSVAPRNFNGLAWDRQRGDTVAQSVLPGLSSTFWNYAAAASGIVNTTTAVTVKAAAGASVRNYISGLSLSWDSLTTATEFCIRDGAGGTVLFRYKIVNGAAGRDIIQFPVPLRGTANTLVEIVTLTASGAGGVFANLQGFTGA